MPKPTIRQALFPKDCPAIIDIWREYIASPSVDLSFQDNEAEFAQLSTKYAPPMGCILLAELDQELIGCIGFRKISPTICEMKKLYVRPKGRGLGLGRLLATQLIRTARDAGYQEMRLDVLAKFEQAQKLYAELGFTAAEPVVFNPIPDTKFLGLKLTDRL